MDLKVVFVIVCLCALAITSTEANIPKCCIKTKKVIHWKVLRKVVRWEMQSDGGACDIPALILHVKDWKSPVCADPMLKNRLEAQKKRRRSAHRDVA